MIELNGGVRPAVATVSQATLDRFTLGPVYPLSGSLVQAQGDPSVWFVDGARLRGVPSLGLAAAWGLTSAPQIVPAGSIRDVERGASLTHFMSCGGVLYAGGEGAAARVMTGDAGGNPVTELSAAACAQLKLTGAPYPGAVFVTDGTRTAVATAGGFHRLPDASSVLRANGGTAPTPRLIAPAYFTSLPQPTQLPASGDVVRASNSPTVTLVDASGRLGIANWGVAADLGVKSRYRIVSPAAVATLPPIAKTIGIFVRCGSTEFIAAQGVLSPVTTTGLAGSTTQQLDAATCATLDLTGAAIPGRVFVQPSGSTQVYVLQAGGLHALAAGESPTVLNGGVAPRILTLDPRTVAGIRAT
jgi:hypothetical protein